MATIVTVYDQRNKKIELNDMSYIRWVKISEALARCGHSVDIATNEFFEEGNKDLPSPISMGKNLRRVPLRGIDFRDYDIVKTLFHTGFKVLEKYGGLDHPFIISKLGSVVGPSDMEGIYFYGDMREDLYKTQLEIDKYAQYVTLLSKPAVHLWHQCFGKKRNVLLVPGAVDTIIPYNSKDPYPKEYKKRCIFAGNIYDSTSQPEANETIVTKLNILGELLSNFDIRLFLLGPGDVSLLDDRYVTYLGATSYENTWQYFYHADVGIVVSAGPFTHNNESTKIYHYLRAGLPVISEAGFPNDNVVKRSKLGFVVESENMELMSQKIKQAAGKKWDKNIRIGINYIIKNHTWDKRVEIYDRFISNSTSKIRNTISSKKRTKSTKKHSNIPKFVFICGAVGSGNTIMFRCLTKHPDVYGINEDDFGGILSRLIKSEIDMGKCPHSIDTYVKFLDEMRGDRKTLVLKTPSNIRHMNIIRKYIPDSSFIIMIREPRTAILSGLERHKRDIGTVADIWHNDYRIFLDSIKQDSLVINFEHFLKSPGKCLDKISAQILPLPASVYEYANRKVKKEIAYPDRWKEIADEKQVQELDYHVQKLGLVGLFNDLSNFV